MKSPAPIAHYQWLDLLRFAAALLVVLNHSRNAVFEAYGALVPESRGALAAAFFATTRLGHEAVIIFFVLSGYLVGGKAIERMIDGSFSPKDFAIDRISRIWVPLLPALVLSALLAHNKDGILVWAGNLIGMGGVIVPVLGGNSPLWSLTYEIWFYILTYAIGLQVKRKSLDFACLALIAASALMFSQMAVQYLACWLIGALFYLKPHRLSALVGGVGATVFCGATIAAIQVTSKGIMAIPVESMLLQAGLEVLLAIGTGVLCVTLTSVRPNRLSAAAVPLAAFSYTLYLTHFPLLIALESAGWKRIDHLNAYAFLWYGVAVAGCLLSAVGMYWMFERNTGWVRRALKRTGIRARTAAAESV